MRKIFLSVCCGALATAALVGCNSSANQNSVADRQNQALADPMDYKVPPTPDVAGDNTSGFDGQGLKKDLNDVVNP
jgi:hypothetical protein